MLRSVGRSLGRSLLARYPDDTKLIARRISRHLEPDEAVLAAVFVQCPGTITAGLLGGTHGGGLPAEEDERHRIWAEQTERFGIDADLARRTNKLVAAVTESRLLLIRRSTASGRVRELLAAWPVAEIDRISVPKRGLSLLIHRGDAELHFELPNEHRFIAQVYRDLPELFAGVRASIGGDAATSRKP